MARRGKPKRKTRKPTTSEQIDRELAMRALEKRRRGETPTSTERTALRRLERQQEEEQRWEFYATIPKKHWAAMAGRQTKVLNEQASRYGIPIGVGHRTIDLSAVVQWLHDFLATQRQKLQVGDDEDARLAGQNSPALERYRDERARLARLERLERERTLLPRAEVHSAHSRMARIIRNAGELLDNEGRQILNEALNDAERELDRSFGEHDRSNTQSDT